MMGHGVVRIYRRAPGRATMFATLVAGMSKTSSIRRVRAGWAIAYGGRSDGGRAVFIILGAATVAGAGVGCTPPPPLSAPVLLPAGCIATRALRRADGIEDFNFATTAAEQEGTHVEAITHGPEQPIRCGNNCRRARSGRWRGGRTDRDACWCCVFRETKGARSGRCASVCRNAGRRKTALVAFGKKARAFSFARRGVDVGTTAIIAGASLGEFSFRPRGGV